MSASAPLLTGVSARRHVAAIVSLPFVNVVVIPALVVLAAASRAEIPFAFSGAQRLWMIAAGVSLIASGAALVAFAIGLFSRRGGGTLAPWDPPRALVIDGAYRHCRNPMKLGLFVILLGEAVTLASPALLVWLAVFAAVNAAYIRLSEEPALAARFGERYAEYCENVPRWVPRRRGWRIEHGAEAQR